MSGLLDNLDRHEVALIPGGNTRTVAGALTTIIRGYAGSSFGTSSECRRLQVQVDPLGSVTSAVFDQAGRQLAQEGPLGYRTSWVYDGDGRNLATVNALGQRSTLVYGPTGQLTERFDPLGRCATMVWDALGRAVAQVDPLGRRASTVYDAASRECASQDALGYRTSFVLDATGNRTAITNPRNYTTTQVHDALGRMIALVDPLGYRTSWVFGAAGQQTGRIDANNQVVTYQRDALGRDAAWQYPDAFSVTFVYDPLGNVTGRTDRTGAYSFRHDALGRTLGATTPVAGGKIVSYTFDLAGRRSTMVDPDNGVTSYQYDSAKRLTSMTNPFGETTTFTHDALGRLVQQDNANGTYSAWAFDAAGNVTNVGTRKSGDTVILSMDYTRDEVGNPTQILEQLLDTDDSTTHCATVTYGYDDLDRLTNEKRTGYQPIWYEYTLDPVGNRTQFVEKDQQGIPTGITNATYDDADRLLTYGATTYTWETNGNQLSKETDQGISTMTWDYENKLVSLVGEHVTTCTYDAQGLRRSK
jgi:YD repeat-containing protein